MHISVDVSKILTRQYQNANTETDTPIAKLTRLGRVWRPYLKACVTMRIGKKLRGASPVLFRVPFS